MFTMLPDTEGLRGIRDARSVHPSS